MKALWSLQPFQQDKAQMRAMFHLLAELTGSKQNVEVGFVVTRTESEINLAYDVPIEKRFTDYPRQILKAVLRKVGIQATDSKVHVVDYPTLSTSKAADRLLTLAQTKRAGLIGIFTQAKKGFRRFALGSFAETLIHRSSLHMLILSPAIKPKKKIQKLFLCLDMTTAAPKEIKIALEFCKTMKASLTIFHAAQVTYRWSMDEENSEVLSYRRKVDQFRMKALEQGTKAGIQTEFVLRSEFEAPHDLALKELKSAGADLLVVSSKGGPLKALMGGSVTRSLVREAPVPVLVLKV